MIRTFLIACLLHAVAAPAQSPSSQRHDMKATGPSAVRVTGEVLHPLTLTAADIAAMPVTTVSAKDKKGVAHTYTGVSLADIFQKAGVTTGTQLRGKNMTKYVLVSCADGYHVVFSLAELDSAFTDRVVILADREDGTPLPAANGPFRIIVPGEKRPARDCFQVAAIAILSAKD